MCIVNKKSNYADLLPDMPRYCCPLDFLFCLFSFYRNMTKITTTGQDYQVGEKAVQCFSQEHNEMAPVGFQPRHCALTT